MPLLRAKELTDIATKAEVSHALCDARLVDELARRGSQCPTLRRVHAVRERRGTRASSASRRRCPSTFDDVATAADDIALIAFTSGTTGQPEGHDALPPRRDGGVRLLADAHAARATATTCSPAARRSRSRSGSAACWCFRCASARRRCWSSARRRTRCSTSIAAAPADRAVHRADVVPRDGARARARATSRACASASSAGEALPAATRTLWKDATGIEIIDGIGVDRDVPHLHLAPRRRRRARARPASRCPATAPA